MVDGLRNEQSIWKYLLSQYEADPKVKQLLFVRYLGGTRANVQLYIKAYGQERAACGWKLALACGGYVGRRGLGKERQGDEKTPVGVYGILTAFGIKKNPGTCMPYVPVTDDLYCCDDDGKYYNRLIHIPEHERPCGGEHMIMYRPDYHYGLFLDYNKEGIPGKGTAIFFHCAGDKAYTEGCIAVKETDMKTILLLCDVHAKICIYEEERKATDIE